MNSSKIIGVSEPDQNYRNEAERVLKEMRAQWIDALKEIGSKTGAHNGSRTLSLSQTKVDEALMWALAHVRDEF